MAGISGVLVLAYALGSWMTVENDSDWYGRLKRPSWQPPDWVFGVIWPYNFVVLLLSMVRVARDLAQPFAWIAVLLLAASVFTALTWSYMFYISRNLRIAAYALGVTVLLTLPLLACVFAASTLHGWLLLPYQIWLAIAYSLAAGYTRLNS